MPKEVSGERYCWSKGGGDSKELGRGSRRRPSAMEASDGRDGAQQARLGAGTSPSRPISYYLPLDQHDADQHLSLPAACGDDHREAIVSEGSERVQRSGPPRALEVCLGSRSIRPGRSIEADAFLVSTFQDTRRP